MTHVSSERASKRGHVTIATCKVQILARYIKSLLNLEVEWEVAQLVEQRTVNAEAVKVNVGFESHLPSRTFNLDF